MKTSITKTIIIRIRTLLTSNIKELTNNALIQSNKLIYHNSVLIYQKNKSILIILTVKYLKTKI